eukprot:1185747-Prorocentrum_minimum.AAC.2
MDRAEHSGSTHAQGTHGGQGGNPMKDTRTHRRSRERATLTAQEGMVSHVLSNIFHINRLKKHGKRRAKMVAAFFGVGQGGGSHRSDSSYYSGIVGLLMVYFGRVY